MTRVGSDSAIWRSCWVCSCSAFSSAREALASVNVITTPSITFSRVRYGRMRTRYQRPSRVATFRSRGASVSSTRSASSASAS